MSAYDIADGQTVSGITLLADDTMFIAPGGEADGTTVESGGNQTDAGLASGTLLDGGQQIVVSGGVASATTVNAGGYQEVDDGGSATGTTVAMGGTAVAEAGGIVTNAEVGGGLLDLKGGATTSGAIAFTSPGTLEIDATVMLGSQAFASPLSSVGAGAVIDLAGLSYTAGQTCASVSGSTLTVTNGTATETFTLQGGSAQAFDVSTDASGGVEVTGVAPPTIAGTHASATASEAAVTPFAGVTVADANANATETLTIAPKGGGTLADGPSFSGLKANPDGTYTLAGTAAAVTGELDALTFAPGAGAPGTSTTTAFTLTDASSAGLFATDATTVVTNADPAVAPTIAGTHATSTTSEAAVTPFAGVTVGDANANATETLTIALKGGGTLADGANFFGLTDNPDGTYTLAGPAAAVAGELDALTFKPAAGAPGTTSTTTFELTDASSAGLSTTDSGASITDTDPAVAPTITGTHANTTTSGAAVTPFAGVTVGDANANAIETLTIAPQGGGTLADGANFSGLVGNPDGSYTLTGTATAVTGELDAVVFSPAAGAPGTSATTALTMTDTSSAGPSAADAGTTVTNTDPAVAARTTSSSAISDTAQGTPPAMPSVTIGPDATYAGHGTFVISGQVSLAAGVTGVDLSADVNGVETDLGMAKLATDGTFDFSDFVGRHVQGFIMATAMDGTTPIASTTAVYSLRAGMHRGATRAEQVTYDAAGDAVTSITSYGMARADVVRVLGAGQTFHSDGPITFDVGRRPDTTFVFDPGFGGDVMNLFRAGGPDHDTLVLPSSEFTSIAQVLWDTHNVGGGAVIHDPSSGDTVLLTGVTKGELVRNSRDIALHP